MPSTRLSATGRSAPSLAAFDPVRFDVRDALARLAARVRLARPS